MDAPDALGGRAGRRALALALALSAALAGCLEEPASTPVFANRVLAYAPLVGSEVTAAEWPYFFAPEAALGEPGGVFDVASLGYDPEAADTLGGTITLGLGDPADAETAHCAVDGAGADLVVYENVFPTPNPATGGSGTHTEVATVQVSADGTAWYLLPPAVDTALSLADPARYHNLAGVTPTAEGGDGFDLAEAIAVHGLSAGFAACYVRLTDGGTAYADFGNTQSDLYASGADIDAVEALHSVAAP